LFRRAALWLVDYYRRVRKILLVLPAVTIDILVYPVIRFETEVGGLR
jgi:hypothetical protein